MSDFALTCPFCRQRCATIRCERYSDNPRKVWVHAFHRDGSATGSKCEGLMGPSEAAHALAVKAIDTYLPIQVAEREP